jgi:hypothetical protein
MRIALAFPPLAGLLIWFGLPLTGGSNEAWDHPLYFLLLPAASFVAGLLAPKQWTLCGFAIVIVQAIAFSIQYALGPGGKFGPLVGLVSFLWFLPFTLFFAWLGSALKRKPWRKATAPILCLLAFTGVASAQTKFESGAIADHETQPDGSVLVRLHAHGQVVVTGTIKGRQTTYRFYNRGYEGFIFTVPEAEPLNVALALNFLWQMSEHARDHAERLAAASPDEPAPVAIDYCTYSPEGWWPECCAEHDAAYQRGGYSYERFAADENLRDCINAQYGPGWSFYWGVRSFGCSFFHWRGLYKECGFLCLQECVNIPY